MMATIYLVALAFGFYMVCTIAIEVKNDVVAAPADWKTLARAWGFNVLFAVGSLAVIVTALSALFK